MVKKLRIKSYSLTLLLSYSHTLLFSYSFFMNKNKIIFIIIWIIILAIIFWGASIIWNKNTKNNIRSQSTWDIKIWVYNLDKAKLESIVNDFKATNKSYNSKNIIVENFPSYKEYEESLNAAIVSEEAPDIFMLNNFEKSYFEKQTLWINPTLIIPNEFRKNNKTFFWDDLIWKTTDWSWKTVEYVTWVPVWYETLWIYYNKKTGVKTADLDSWAAIGSSISWIKERNSDIVPIWIWNWSTVYDSQDIITQLFMLWDSSSFWKVWDTWLKEALGTYFSYADDTGENAYDLKYEELKKTWKINLDLFSDWNMTMVIGYPSMINRIDEWWFSKNLLFAAPFPHYISSKVWKTLVRYNYFVVNKNTKDQTIAFDFLKYLSIEKWAKNFLSKFTYFLPAIVTLEQDMLEQKIHNSYNITLWDFYKPWDETLLSSFDKWIVKVYDEKMIEVLDNKMDYMDLIVKLQKNIECRYKKVYSLENLGTSCE